MITGKPVVAWLNIDIESSKRIKKEDAKFDKTFKQLPQDNNRFHIERTKKTNTFTVWKDERQTEKIQIVKLIKAIHNKIKMSKSKKEISELKKLKKNSNRKTKKTWRIRIRKWISIK